MTSWFRTFLKCLRCDLGFNHDIGDEEVRLDDEEYFKTNCKRCGMDLIVEQDLLDDKCFFVTEV